MMHSLLLSIALLLNMAVVVGAVAVGMATDAAPFARFIAAALALLAGGAWLLLILARFGRLPPWGRSTMRALCAAFPLLWLLGSLDHGIVSGQELLSLILVVALYWGTWRVFRRSAVPAV